MKEQVVILGTMDTKSDEFGFVKKLIEQNGSTEAQKVCLRWYRLQTCQGTFTGRCAGLGKSIKLSIARGIDA